MFGWLHPAASVAARGTVVVLCPPLGIDHICVYRSWRILAERLAAAGFPVLRFDYLGTGNSAEDAEGPDRVARWRRSIEVAVEHARSRTGAKRVALVGLRLGATLAATAAPGIEGVDSLVLWSPIRSGQLYAREVSTLARLSGNDAAGESGDVEAAGFLLRRSTIEELGDLDLLALRDQPAARVLLIERDNFAPDPQLLARLRHLGCTVTEDRSPGTVDVLAQPMHSKVPEQILDRIVGWLSEGPGALAAAPVVLNQVDGAAGHGEGWREQPMFFGPDRRLFGILTRPVSDESPATAVVFLNTGCEYHVGPHRMYVPLARAWARLGYASFRFDIGGIGDSLPPAGVTGTNPYPAHAMEDVAAAVAEVRRVTAAQRLVVMGICSGGWHAFLAARDGLPVDEIMAINAPLYLREGAKYTVAELADQQELGRYVRATTDPQKWQKLLRGQVGVGTLLRLASAGTLRWLRAEAATFGLQSGSNNLGGDLRSIGTRRVRASFVFSHSDLALTYFHLHAKGPIRRARGRLAWTVVKDADHTFCPLPAQRTLRELMMDFLKQGGEYQSNRL